MKKTYSKCEGYRTDRKDAIMLVISGKSGNAGTGKDLSNKFYDNYNNIWNNKW